MRRTILFLTAHIGITLGAVSIGTYAGSPVLGGGIFLIFGALVLGMDAASWKE